MKYFFTFILLLFYLFSTAQNIKGDWNGLLYQEKGGLSERYYFSMYLVQEGEKIRGFTKINLLNNPNTFGRMKFKGTFDGRYLRFEEIEIVDEKINRGQWCLKKGKLELSLGKEGYCLEGSWGGILAKNGGVCVPGTLKVCQLVPIAYSNNENDDVKKTLSK